MFRALVGFLLGHLRIQVRSACPERFLNLCVDNDIVLWDIERQPDWLLAEISLPSFLRIRPVARSARARVRILDRRGLPFVTLRLKRRPLLVAGAVLCGALLWWVSGYVWYISIQQTGEGLLDQRVVRAIAAEAGLRPGVRKRQVDTSAVEERLVRRISELSWASVSIQGVRARIQVVEKTGYPTAASIRTDLVARKAGLIVHLVTFDGEPAVKVGDYVRPDDTLIKGCLYYFGAGRPQVFPGTPVPPRDTVARCGPAEGQIRARVWYERYVEIPLVRERRTPTGQREFRLVLKWREREIIVLGRKVTSFAAFEERRYSLRLPQWRNWQFPVEINSLVAAEVRVHRETVSQERAAMQAQESLRRHLQFQLGPTDRIASIRAEVVQVGHDFVGIRLTAETVEEIGTPKEVADEPISEQPLEKR